MKKLPYITNLQQHGFAPMILLLLASAAIIIFILITNTASFNNTLFSKLFLKPPSFASGELSLSGLKVSGNKIINTQNQIIKLLGINRSGAEYACIQGWGIFDGPIDTQSVDAMKTWNINTVRIPLNESCWLGINGVKSEYGGENYKTAILNYVNLLTSKGLAVILELHWSAPGTQPATGQQPMPDRDHTPTFWISVANTFKTNPSVLFDLFNEPYPDNNQDTSAAWKCWRDGGTCSGMSYQAAGMQELVNAVRSTGATNIIMIGGVQYSNSLSKWLEYKPNDPLNNLVASWHVYNFNPCNSQTCWDTQVAPIIAQVPLVATEIGENTCAHGFIDPLMNWLDNKGSGYLGWTWNTWDCKNGPALISNYNGTPTPYGIGFRDHLVSLNMTPSPSTEVSPSLTPIPSATTDPTPSPTPAADTINPAISITNPQNGALIKTNSYLNIQASASDNVRVSKVEFYVPGSTTPKCIDTTAPYSCATWKVPGRKNQTYTISVKAYDSSNNSSSTSVTVKSQ